MLFVETSHFTAELARYLSDEEYRQYGKSERSDIDQATLRQIAGKLKLLK
jgi:hypothetical protein